MNTKLSRFLVRWGVSVLGLWIAAELLGQESLSFGGQTSAIIISGLILAIMNTLLRPIIVLFTLPAVLLTLGIFMVFINGFMVVVAAWLYGPLEVSGFGVALITGIVVGLVNWLVSALLEDNNK
jgi:putative membrane protein